MKDLEFVQDYNKRMELIMEEIQKQADKTPKRLLLHSCCAPCSSAVLERLTDVFEVTVFYYNPNISPAEEYEKRVQEQQRFLKEVKAKYPISFLEGDYIPKQFYDAVKGLEEIKEGGKRCYQCYQLRLAEAVRIAAENKYDYVTTTLSVSPYKNAKWLNEIGEQETMKYEGLQYLYADFKKKNGYRRSIALSKEHNLYRQDFCGCEFSKKERMFQKSDKNL